MKRWSRLRSGNYESSGQNASPEVASAPVSCACTTSGDRCSLPVKRGFRLSRSGLAKLASTHLDAQQCLAPAIQIGDRTRWQGDFCATRRLAFRPPPACRSSVLPHAQANSVTLCCRRRHRFRYPSQVKTGSSCPPAWSPWTLPTSTHLGPLNLPQRLT